MSVFVFASPLPREREKEKESTSLSLSKKTEDQRNSLSSFSLPRLAAIDSSVSVEDTV